MYYDQQGIGNTQQQHSNTHNITFECENFLQQQSSLGAELQPQYKSWQKHTTLNSVHVIGSLEDFDNTNNNGGSAIQHQPNNTEWYSGGSQRKLHSSCNNLSSFEGGVGNGSNYNTESDQIEMYLENDHNILQNAKSVSNPAAQNGHCNIGNCGKILWISRNRDELNGGHAASLQKSTRLGKESVSIQRRCNTNSYSSTLPNGVIVRTNSQGLPYTPLPHQRQAYLANQHAIEAAIPLVVNGTITRKSKSPNRYLESDVNIHYKTPIRHEYKDSISEEELANRQAEQMHKLYQEERRRKYLQELKDMSSRRHTDNFIPSQKSPIPLNRYDDFQTDLTARSYDGASYSKTLARALYNFVGQTARELSFKKGDTIFIRRQVDKNWYEGEHNAMIGLLPANYVEILSTERKPQKRSSEGHARAKFTFQAQSGVELSLNKGELVTLTRRVDDNWFEGKIANRKGIFPVSYVEVLSDIGSDGNNSTKTIITSSSTTNLRPPLDTLRTNINNEFNTITQNGHQAPSGILRETKNLRKSTTDVLHVDTNTEPIAYRSLYKYRPQNSDELELLEGDIIHVLEKCDDGWFVGTSQRTGCFGTFPGNYVECA